jgi:hypothetical protein
MTKPTAKYQVISVYIPSELKALAEAVAARQGRKLGPFIRWCVMREVAREKDRKHG